MDESNIRETTESVRQAIMRLRELLNHMTQQLQSGEQAYTGIMATISDADKHGLREKEQQWRVAEQIVAGTIELATLQQAALRLRLASRDLEHGFEELYDAISAVAAAIPPEEPPR